MVGAQIEWVENTRDFPSKEIPLGYRLRLEKRGQKKGDRKKGTEKRGQATFF